MNIQNAVSLLGQRLAKQLWVSIALASFLPLGVALYVVACLLDPSRPSPPVVVSLLGFAMIFSLLGSYLIHIIWRKLHSLSERALKQAAPLLDATHESTDELGQLDTAIDRFTSQLRDSMDELHRKAHELSTAKRQLEQANRQLQRLDKMKTDFLRFISHEFRSPLMCVRMALHSLLDEPDLPLAQDQEKFVDIALRSSERLLRLINQMIDLTKIRQSRRTQERQEIELRQVVSGILAEFKEPFESKRIEFRHNGNARAVHIAADRESLEVALRHVFQNVAENAPEQGNASVCVNETEMDVEIVVIDNGPRIVPRKFGDLFEGLVRQYEDNDPRWRNDVLGLTLAKEIISLQGGSLDVDCEPDEGGQLLIRLPKENKKP